MVVRGNGQRLDTSIDQKLGQDALDLCLTRLEVVSANESLVLLCELDTTGNKGVLRRSIDEWHTFEDRRNGKDGRGGDFLVGRLDCLEEIVRRIIDTGNDFGVSFRVGGPEYDEIVQLLFRFELSNVRSDLVEVLALVITGNEVVGSVFLVGSDKVGVCKALNGVQARLQCPLTIDTWHGNHSLHVGFQLPLEVPLENLGTRHGLVHGHTRNVPSANDKVVGMNHG